MSAEICPICYEDLNDDHCKLTCEHNYCNMCIFKYVKDKIEDHEIKIYCPYESCDTAIPGSKIKEIIWDDNNLLNDYNNMCDPSTYSMCPKCKKICQKGCYDEINRIDCSDCKEYYCFICGECHEDWSDYNNCPNQSKIENTISEIMSALELDDKYIKLCPICKIIIYKEEGCSAVRCKYCKIKFCWECLKIQSEIEKLESHECEDFNRYQCTGSDDEYINGFD